MVNTHGMDRTAAALGDAARWRIVELLAEHPRSVGELAELTGLRQPQTTKHLQTLARAGLVTVFPLGQRRVYAMEAAPLAALAERLRELVEMTEAHQGERDAIARYRAAIEADSVPDAFSFERVFPASPTVVWRHWVDPGLLASWWVPPPMTITECVVEPRAGGRVVLNYRDREGNHYQSGGRVRSATKPRHLVFDLSVLGAAGSVLFTGHYDVTFAVVPGGTRLHVDLRISGATAEAHPYLAGIETGWGQVLDNLNTVLVNFTNRTSRKERR